MQDLRELTSNKEVLLSIIENNYDLPADIDPFSFAQALLPNFGSTDGELRDDLSYMILATSIISRQRLDAGQLQALLDTVLDDEHLFYGIGERYTNSVFMRSFSNLIVAAILFSDARDAVFEVDTIQRTKDALLRYASEEKDWRGYVEGKGWAHAMAHLSDALDECAQHPAMGEADRKEILECVSRLAILPVALYHEEDVRLAKIPYHIILGHQLDEEFLETWLQQCTVSRESDVVSWMRVTNAKNFLRSLYFLIYWDNIMPVLLDHIADILKQQEEVYLENREG